MVQEELDRLNRWAGNRPNESGGGQYGCRPRPEGGWWLIREVGPDSVRPLIGLEARPLREILTQVQAFSVGFACASGKTTARKMLFAAFLDWRNNYLSPELFAEHNGLLLDEAEDFLTLARKVFSHDHPDA